MQQRGGAQNYTAIGMRCSIGREGLTLNSVKWSSRIWWGRGRTRTLVPRVGGSLISGKPTRADRRLSHSRIFFREPRVLDALSRSDRHSYLDASIAAYVMGTNALQLKDIPWRTPRMLLGLARWRRKPSLNCLFIFWRIATQGAVKSLEGRDRTGRLGTHFFTQNSGNIFFRGDPFGHRIAEVEAKR
jgi:hypothetical protein